MYQEQDARLGLAEYLTALQAELHSASAQAEQHDLPFGVDSVTLEIDISFTLARSAEARSPGEPEFWVTDVTAQANDRNAPAPHWGMQRLTVRLSPRALVADAVQPNDLPPSSLPRTRLAD
ncbi:MAG TPA: trypco2 family protein [Burkholderiaceae bacterium]|nr:trypco2 family protein [Burkholderiaceae bacterium]